MDSHGFTYFVLFVDDCSQMCWVHFFKHKYEVFDVFVKYYNVILIQIHAKPKILRSDNGGEYISVAMKQFFCDYGLVHQTSCPDTPQQNGVAERKNLTLLEIARALMFETHIPICFWPETIATATYLTNRLPTKILNFQTPFPTLNTFTPVPSFHSLPPRIFGCVVYVHLSSRVRNKFEPWAVNCVFLGYDTTQKGYRCYDPVHNKLYTTMDCDFFEQSLYYTQPRSQGEIVSEDLSWLIHPLADS